MPPPPTYPRVGNLGRPSVDIGESDYDVFKDIIDSELPLCPTAALEEVDGVNDLTISPGMVAVIRRSTGSALNGGRLHMLLRQGDT